MSRPAGTPPPAVVAGLNINGLAVARTLGRAGIPVYGISFGPPGEEARSRYFRRVREADSANWIDLLLDWAEELGGNTPLFPVTDLAVTRAAARSGDLEGKFLLPFSPPGTALDLLDKEGFHREASRLGFPVPATFFVSSPEEMEAALEEVPFPCIVKPVVKTRGFLRSGARKAHIAHHPEEAREAYRSFSSAEPRALVQEYVPGGDGDVWFCLLYMNSRGEASVSFTGRKLRQWPPLSGGTSACEPAREPKLEEMSVRFFREVGFQGICSMEFKRDPTKERFFMVEPTVGRTDWQSALADANGVPIPLVAYREMLGLSPPPLRRKRIPRRWIHLEEDRAAASALRERGELSPLAWLLSMRPPIRWTWWAWDDPAPFLARIRRRWKEKFR